MGRSLSWSRRELAADPVQVAEQLLGSQIAHHSVDGTVVVRLTEVEAYGGALDPASHAFHGLTKRNAVMFGPAGYAYVYFTYGMHWCLNVSCGADGDPAAVLLRAGEVVEGRALSAARRPGCSPRDLARGPARLTKALGVTGEHDGLDLLSPHSPLQLRRAWPGTTAVQWGPRVGVSGAGAPTPWRAWIAAEPTVSAYRAAAPRRKPTASK